MKTALFCTESMAKSLLFLPVQMAPGHLVDAREIHAAQQRISAAVARYNQPPQQLDLF